MSSELYAFEQLDSREVLGAGVDDLERLREQAISSGFQEGRAQGLEQARQEVESAVAALSNAATAVFEVRTKLISELERDAAELAVALAEKVLAGALDIQPERVIDVTRAALRRLSDRRRVTLVVNPSDLERVSRSAAELTAELGGIEHCEVQADRRVEAGGVIVRTQEGEIDVTIDAQLERARELVAGALSDEV